MTLGNWRHAAHAKPTSMPEEPDGQADDAALRHMFGRDFVYVLGGVVPLALSALILPILTRLMGREEFGIVSFAVAVSWVLYIFLSLGLQIGIQREYPKLNGAARSRELVASSSLFIVVVSAVLAMTSHEWAPLVSAGRFPWAMELISIWSGAAAIALICLGLLRSQDRLGPFWLVVLTQSVGAQLIGVVLLVTRGHFAHEYLLGLVIGQVAAAALALGLVRPRPSGAVKVRSFGRLLPFSLPLVANQLSTFLLWSGDRFVVQRDLGSVAQARYAVAYAVGAIAINVISQLNQAWMPRVFAIETLDKRRRVLAEVQKRLLRLLTPSVLGVSLAAPFLLVVASPGSYRPHTLLLVTLLIVPTALPFSFALANVRALVAHGKTGRLAAATFACSVLNIALNVWWVPHLGITGSALATLVSYACWAWLSGLLVRNEADRLPERLKGELFIWFVAGLCLASALIPRDVVGTLFRAVAVLALAWILVIQLMRMRRHARFGDFEPDRSAQPIPTATTLQSR